ncbi:hypothetical protein ScPMuIL_012417 [Solemya velum]
MADHTRLASSGSGGQKRTCGSILRAVMKKEIKDLKSLDLYRACLAEFIGTTILVLFAIGAGLHHQGTEQNSSVHISLMVGFYVAVIITAFALVSGAHVNPVITIGFAVQRKISLVRFFFYVLTQSLAGVAGTAILIILTPKSMHGNFGLIKPGLGITDEQALLCELIISFLLMFATAAMLDNRRTDVQSVPLMVGLTVSVNIFFAWNISGGCMNPARNFGPAIITGDFDKQWIYWVGPLIGGAVGALLYEKVFSVNACETGIAGICRCDEYDSVATEEKEESKRKVKGSKLSLENISTM